MPRIFLDDLRNSINALIVPNDAGEITADVLRPLLIDAIDSTIQDEGAIASNTPSPGIVTGAAWFPLSTGIYDLTVGGDDDFITLDPVNGSIKATPINGFSYSIRGNVSFTDMQNNRQINFVILADGSPVGFVSRDTGRGNGKPVSVTFTHLSLSTPSDTVYQIGVQTDDGANTVDILDIGLSVIVQPTNNP